MTPTNKIPLDAEIDIFLRRQLGFHPYLAGFSLLRNAICITMQSSSRETLWQQLATQTGSDTATIQLVVAASIGDAWQRHRARFSILGRQYKAADSAPATEPLLDAIAGYLSRHEVRLEYSIGALGIPQDRGFTYQKRTEK